MHYVTFLSISSTLTFIQAEEGGSGKIILLENGAYDEMDVCLMYGVVILLYLNNQLTPCS